MLFVISAQDKPNHLETRKAARPEHLKFWDENEASLVLAGPYLDANGDAMGSMLVVKADDLAGAQALIDADPYSKVALFDTVTITPWNWVIKRPEGL